MNTKDMIQAAAPPFPFVPLTDEEILQLAKDIRDGLIFTSGDPEVQTGEQLMAVFPGVELLAQWAERIGFLYAYRSKALEKTFQGLPTFDHVTVLILEDAPRLQTALSNLSEVS